MFYKELLSMETDNNKNLIEDIDTYLGLFHNKEKRYISPVEVSKKYNIDIKEVIFIFEKLCEVNILKQLLFITCPDCKTLLKITSKENLYNDIVYISENNEYRCKNKRINLDNIYVLYKLLKSPTNNSIEIQKKANKLLGV